MLLASRARAGTGSRTTGFSALESVLVSKHGEDLFDTVFCVVQDEQCTWWGGSPSTSLGPLSTKHGNTATRSPSSCHSRTVILWHCSSETPRERCRSTSRPRTSLVGEVQTQDAACSQHTQCTRTPCPSKTLALECIVESMEGQSERTTNIAGFGRPVEQDMNEPPTCFPSYGVARA